MNELLDSLNNSQKEAVLYNEGPSLVIAGAGSGKTRVLTHKIARLLQEGYQPWSILALTFTNKAAREMKERIATLVDPQSASRLWMGTFHSLFFRILRAESKAIGFPEGFTIYDTADSKSLLKSIIKEMGLDDKIYKVGALQSRISAVKNELISPEAYAGNGDLLQQDIQAKRPLTREIYLRYVQRCRMARAMDFDDLLFQTNVLFRDYPDILARYQDQFRFILVDEYQDTNFSQYLIVKKLAEKHHHICVVGDDSQSIYSFRGANIENILHFKNAYPEGRIFKLEQNYRSTQTIVNAANSLIAKNKGQIHKTVFSEKEAGSRIKVLSAYSDLEEGMLVAGSISEMRLRTFDSLNDFVILYRTNAQSRIFEEALRKRNLPYRVYGGLSFYQRKEIKDVIAYLRLLANENDEEAFKRVVNYPARGIGETTVQKLTLASSEHGISLWNILQEPSAYGVSIHSGTANKLESFRVLMASLAGRAASTDVYELTRRLISETGIQREIDSDHSPEVMSRKENIQELLTGMHSFVEDRREEGNEAVFLLDFLQEVSLLTDQDESRDKEGERVTMMTIHAAKGLEFKHVFVAGLEEDIFPSMHSVDSEKSLEEERRLLYVAITRAGETCVLSYAKSRFRNGQSQFSKPSRFLKDLEPSLLDAPADARLSTDDGPRGWDQERSGWNNRFPERSPSENRWPASGSAENRRSALGSSENRRPESFRSSEPKDNRPDTVRLSGSNPLSHSGKPLKKIAPQAESSTQSASTAGYASDTTGLSGGSIIVHERFGKGVVKSVEGTGDNAKIEVEFENSGYRKLLLKFARFTIIG